MTYRGHPNLTSKGRPSEVDLERPKDVPKDVLKDKLEEPKFPFTFRSELIRLIKSMY